MKEYHYCPYEGYKCEVDLQKVEREHVLEMNDETRRLIAKANIDGRVAYLNLKTHQVIIMPCRSRGKYTVLDENGNLVKKRYRPTKRMQAIHDELWEYMCNVDGWLNYGICTFDAYDLEGYDTPMQIGCCMENFIKCMDPNDRRAHTLREIMHDNPWPAIELLYNIRRMGLRDMWDRHFLAWRTAELNQYIGFFHDMERMQEDMDRYIDEHSSDPDCTDNLPF
ncbi:MAG: hypothetical protein LIP02_13205 [Bacteroidales bacterium]|nr:hypothetical protein [Bacteroidales bacterium]